jgi:uncharacterized membrane protein
MTLLSFSAPTMVAAANGLPYSIPIHPNLVHLTLGLFILAIAFDIVAALYPLEKPIFKFLAIPVQSSNLYDVGWFNMLARRLSRSLQWPLAFTKSSWLSRRWMW